MRVGTLLYASSRPLQAAAGIALVFFILLVVSYRAEAAPLAAVTLDKAALTHDKQKSNNDKLTAQGEFRLSAGAVIDPATEPVTLTIGSFSSTIPPQSFTKKSTAKKTTWTFKGAKGGPPKMTVVQTGE